MSYGLCFFELDVSTSSPRSSAPAKLYKRFGHRLILFNSLKHFAHPSPNFHEGRGVKSPKFGFDF